MTVWGGKKKIVHAYKRLKQSSVGLLTCNCLSPRLRVKNQFSLFSFFASLTENEATLSEKPSSSPHPHRCSYLLCLCVWCCWPPSGSPGVFYASLGDRTPYVAVDYDGEDLRKSRFAVLLRRPSFSGLLFMLALLLRLNPPFPFFTQLEQCR